MGKLGSEMKALAKRCGGSHKTVNDRIHIVQRFDHHLRALNIQIQKVAQDAIHHYLAQGFSRKEALAMVAMDLGHGDGRGRYVAQVYGLQREV
ncbi:hypothetical protein BWL71_07590 [Salmonella enterica]|nr:hypothetical protein [Salmonella enterica]